MRQTMTVLAALVTLATATAGPATRPAPTSMTVDELRRELVTLRRENAELRARLDRLEAPADDEPERLPAQIIQPTSGSLTWMVDAAAGSLLYFTSDTLP